MRTLLFIVSLLLLVSCVKDKGLPVADECPDRNVSFKADVQSLFDTHCNIAGCHSGPNPSGNLSLEADLSFDQLSRKGKGYVDTINPSFSVLHSQVNSIYNPMPPSGNLPACDIKTIYNWMAQGAKNN